MNARTVASPGSPAAPAVAGLATITFAKLGAGVYAVLVDGAYAGDVFCEWVNHWGFDSGDVVKRGYLTRKVAGAMLARELGWRWR